MRNPIKYLFQKKSTAYKAVFNKESRYVKTVLADLRIFCHATGSPFNADPITLARNIGRQEVFERIRSYTNVTEDEIYQLTETLENEYGE